MSKKEKRILLYVAGGAFFALWVAVVAFGDVLGVSEEAKDSVMKVSAAAALFLQSYLMKRITGMKDTDGDGIPDELDEDE